MCGIIGILGKHEVSPIILEALKRLEYRGYDSAGIATVTTNGLDRRRAPGKLVELSDQLVHAPLVGQIGIGHTRWATHGAPTKENAHPHRAGPVAVVHNGIIENFDHLRKSLSENGAVFATDTDTETIVQLIASLMEKGLGPIDAVKEALPQLHGAYAIAIIFENEPDLMIVARRGSPLVIGHGTDEMFVGSDAIALSGLTNAITYLDEGDWAVVRRKNVQIFDADNKPVERPIKTIEIDAASVEKGGYKHWMAKEIAEQPNSVSTCLAQHLAQDGLEGTAADIDFAKTDRIILVACGTAYLACFVAKYWLEYYTRLPVEVDIASEFRYRNPPIGANNIAIFVSQSGETADTLAALRYCKGKARTISIVNAPESSIARESDHCLLLHAGVEIGVASTKAFTCQLTVLALLALKASKQIGHIDPSQIENDLSALHKIPALISQSLNLSDNITAIARVCEGANDVLFLGRGPMYPLALEAALKLKELTYIHAEGYASGELKHGPIALVDDTLPIVVMAPSDAQFEKTISNMQEVKARGGRIILITDADGAARVDQDVEHIVTMPAVSPIWAPILYAIPAQLLAYQSAIVKGTDVDQPRNLAKSVTVE